MKHAYILSIILSRCSVVNCLDCSLIFFMDLYRSLPLLAGLCLAQMTQPLDFFHKQSLQITIDNCH